MIISLDLANTSKIHEPPTYGFDLLWMQSVFLLNRIFTELYKDSMLFTLLMTGYCGYGNYSRPVASASSFT